MNVSENKDHIMIIDDLMTKNECDEIIEMYDLFESTGETRKGQEDFGEYPSTVRGSLRRNDHAMWTWDYPGLSKFIISKVEEGYQYYKNEFFQIESANITFAEAKIQRTPIRGGFHEWHCETGDISTIERCLVWMIYLNDIPDNEGETEFLWQKMRVKPKAGRFVMWPAFFTHVHRGNPVYTHSKYIATGWGTYTDSSFDEFYIRDESGFYHANPDRLPKDIEDEDDEDYRYPFRTQTY